MDKNEMISIIVPVYNKEQYIKKCLDSLINQTYENIEIIIINDGSTDDSEKIIKEYDDKRIKYYKNKNQGIGKTRNYGIEKSQGNYIMFVDIDDYIDKNACEILLKKAKTNNNDIVITNYYNVEKDKITKNNIEKITKHSINEEKDILLKVNLAPWNKIYKKELIISNNIKFEENLKYEDAVFVIEALIKANNIGQIDDYLYYYVIHEESETTVRDEKVFDIIKVVDKIRKEYGKDELKETIDKLTIKILTNYTIQQRYQKDKNIGKKFINEAFLYMKNNIKDYKNNKYYKGRPILKRTIEKSRFLSNTYCNIYRKTKMKK